MLASSRTSLFAAAASALLLGLSGCGGGDDPTVVAPGGPGGTPEPGETSTPPPSSSQPPPTGATTGAPSGAPPSPDAGASSVPADLTIAVDDGSGAVTTYTLTCEPPRGTHPDPAAACAELPTVWPDAFQPVPSDRACTMVYGGPQTATITGTVTGQQVLAEFDRTNGCEIGRWQAVEPLLGPAGQVGGPDT